ncbi:odorant receptor 43a-like [Tenebrio molitor]|uniref:odorant receptor 43a-like n=1 Tax=Tenebrio molitor TaxID=7067 RepID=UPI0036247383
MSAEAETDYFQFAVKCYEQSGLRRTSKFFQKCISVYILYPSLIVFCAMVIINFRYKHDTISEMAEVFASVLLVRKTIILTYGSFFEDLYRKRIYFWKYDLFGKIKGNQYRKRMASCVSLVKVLWSIGFFSIAVHSGAPIFVESMVLPHACWIPGNNFIIQVILHVMETIFFFETALLVGMFDEFYLLMCTELKIQFELLSTTVKSIKFGMVFSKDHEEICWRKLTQCTKYHNFLLGSSNLPQIVANLFVLVIVNGLFLMAVIPASEVEIESENLALEIYNMDWYNARSFKIHKFLLFWLAQTQIPVQMSGAGILMLNRPLMLRVQRIGYSVSTLLSGLK